MEACAIAVDIRLIHQGEYLSYYEIDYKLSTGEIKTYEMVSKTGSKYNNTKELTLETIGNKCRAIVLLVLNRDHTSMLLTREFRLGVNQWVYNDVAGLIDEDETAEQAAARELKEETGLNLVSIIDKLELTFTCAPVTDDLTQLFICEADGEIINSTNPIEQIESRWVSKEEMRYILESSEITFAGRMQAFAYMWVKGGLLE